MTNRRAPLGRPVTREASTGQSIVEFALIAPILVVLVLAVVDMARIYTTMIAVESAAREAADYGTFGSQRWNSASYPTITVPAMRYRGCVASKNLPDYVGPDDSCTNPSMTVLVSGDKGATWQTDPATVSPACDDETRAPPCWMKVTLTYDFHLIAPLNLEAFGVHFGLPSTISIVRSSVFATTDLNLPTPTP